jgi:hypothetical protein
MMPGDIHAILQCRPAGKEHLWPCLTFGRHQRREWRTTSKVVARAGLRLGCWPGDTGRILVRLVRARPRVPGSARRRRSLLLSGEHHNLAFARGNSRQSSDVHLMRHQDQRTFPVAPFSDQLPRGTGLGLSHPPVVKERVKGGRRFDLAAEGKARCVKCAAPSTRKYARNMHALSGKTSAEAFGLFSASVRKVALGSAILELKPCGISGARGTCMADQRHRSALTECSPGFLRC